MNSDELLQIVRQKNLTEFETPDEEGQTYLDQVIETVPDKTSREKLKRELIGWGPLQDIIHDPDVSEIIITDHKHIYIERGRDLSISDETFETQANYEAFIERLCHETNMNPNLQHPFADGTIGPLRLHVITPPIAPSVAQLTIRRHRESPWTLDQLFATGWADPGNRPIIERLVKQKKNILVTGPTSSGKTSVLNALLSEIQAHERTIIIEDTSEIQCPNPLSTKLLTRPSQVADLPDIHQDELVKQSLRMRPDRLVVGEVRGHEAKDLLLALGTGHRGSMGSIHGSCARSALNRLELLVQFGAPKVTPKTIRQLIASTIDVVLVLSYESGQRKLASINQVAGLDANMILLDSPV